MARLKSWLRRAWFVMLTAMCQVQAQKSVIRVRGRNVQYEWIHIS